MPAGDGRPARRRTGDEEGRAGPGTAQADDVADARRPSTTLPWSVPSPSGWRVASPAADASSRCANRPSVVGLEEPADDAAVAGPDLPPAASAPALGHGPGHDRPVGSRPHPAEPDRLGHESGRCPPRRARLAPARAASSSPASAGGDPPRIRTSRSRYSRSTVPRSRTRASSSPAAAPATSTSTQSEASGARSRPAACPARSRSGPTRAPLPDDRAPSRRRRARAARPGPPC